MKSQDIVVLLKLVSLHQKLRGVNLLCQAESSGIPFDWQGWADQLEEEYDDLSSRRLLADAFSVRGLEASLGISKSEVNASIKRSYANGLSIKDRKSGYPKANIPGLIEFIVHGLKYVFPAEPGAMVYIVCLENSACELHHKVVFFVRCLGRT